jgi:thiol-disulfide isomerase/thioredoxin
MNEIHTTLNSTGYDETSASHTSTGLISGPYANKLATLFRSPDLNRENFDHNVLSDADDSRLKVVFFWGVDCPNCAMAKQQLAHLAPELGCLPVDFHSVNTYENMDLATRFGLYGIPDFLFFKRGRLIGRMTSFPTREEFLAAVQRKI